MPNVGPQYLWFMFVDIVVEWRNLGNSKKVFITFAVSLCKSSCLTYSAITN